MPSRRAFRSRVLVLVLVGIVVGISALGVLPTAEAHAAGTWATGILTNNSVDDASPQLTSTHLVWAQWAGPLTWNIRLRELSTGVTKTIHTAMVPVGIPSEPLMVPNLSMAGDYVTIFGGSGDVFHLHEISSGVTRALGPIAPGTRLREVVTDGMYVVVAFDDGDREIAAYDIPFDAWVWRTANSVDDYLGALDRGRIAYVEDRLLDSSVILYELGWSRQTTISTPGGPPLVSGDWVCYQDGMFAGPLRLYRTSDGFRHEANPGWIVSKSLTDDHLFWVEQPPADFRKYLYSCDLRTLHKTQIASTTAFMSILAAEGHRVVYAIRATEDAAPSDLMVVDMRATSVEPYRLAHNLEIVTTMWRTLGDLTLCGDLIVVSASDGSDAELGWARWVEDASTVFTDVSTDHPYASAIAQLSARGIISGYGGGRFGPDDPVMRQQFAKMIVRTTGIPPHPTTATRFTDLGAPDSLGYPHIYVQAAWQNGITRGINSAQTLYAPYRNITRAQVVTMVVRAADNLAGGVLVAVPAGWTAGVLPYSDPDHGANLRKAEYNGLLEGIRSSLYVPGLAGWNIYGNASRAEVAQVLWNLLRKLE